MKTIVIIGCGQMGQAAAGLIDRNKNRILAYGENDKKKWSTSTDDGRTTPIMSVEQAIGLQPDAVLIGVMGKSRTEELMKQVRSAGFSGAIMLLQDFYDVFDIRSKCIRLLASEIRAQGIEGEIAELGVYRADMAWQMNELFPDKKLYLFDTFEGFDSRDIWMEKVLDASGAEEKDFSDTSLEMLMERFPYPDNVVVRKGYFPETTAGMEMERFSLVSLDADLYNPTLSGLEYFYPRLMPGGVIILHDYNNSRFSGVKKAVEAYEKKEGWLCKIPLGDLHGSCVIMNMRGGK